MEDIKKVTKIWASWNSDKIEDWLESMEAQGWQLVKIKYHGYRMHFKKGVPRKVRYCVDFQGKKDKAYEALCLEAGWKCELSASGWYIWSMLYTTERPAIYTDVDSLIDRNKRLIATLSVAMTAQIPILMITLNNRSSRYTFMVLHALVFGLLFYGIVQLNKKNRKLRDRSEYLK
ncbi:DUF2812 domain-containing protein [Paenibacillus alba]|uniref:DUF2812 domain-containing protein n=1 Tax=Paenibacillus alba TaxID=1197127 RepID=A0ABU6G753_9BACL|nr:DUF2812 domain-containing protein [Paenibacillus alba]MEC0229469.1 DUF2812 domain-containing protein [Paenibacillus alba]